MLYLTQHGSPICIAEPAQIVVPGLKGPLCTDTKHECNTLCSVWSVGACRFCGRKVGVLVTRLNFCQSVG